MAGVMHGFAQLLDGHVENAAPVRDVHLPREIDALRGGGGVVHRKAPYGWGTPFWSARARPKFRRPDGYDQEPGTAASGATTSPFCARCRSACSITTSASIASAIGVARMPTHGSCRPLVTTSVGSPRTLIVSRGLMIELVGLIAIDTSRSC